MSARAGNLFIRVSDDERAALEQAAQSQHLTVSAWLRALGLKEADRLKRDMSDARRRGAVTPLPKG